MNIKLTIKYNGTRYQGWQRLGEASNSVSIQGILEEALGDVLEEKVRVTGSGRTDAGVHAYGQVANFHTKREVDLTTLRGEVNRRLPKEIQIVSAAKVPEEFHSRYSARSKCYEYHIDNGRVQNVFTRETCLHVPDKLDVSLMREAAKLFVGTHDFCGFASKMPDGRPTVKTIYEVEIASCDSLVTITYRGDGFLYNMVRIMTGTLIEVGLKIRSPESIRKVFETNDRQLAGKTVEGKGLFLVNVVYI